MLRKVFPVVLFALVFVVTGVSQPNPKEQLQQQLLAEKEVQELLGAQWLVDALSELDGVAGGVANVVGTFMETSTSETLVIGLISFENAEAAVAYVAALSENRVVTKVRNLLEEVKENQALLPERLVKETDQVILLELSNGLHQLMIRRSTMILFFRSSMTGPVNLEKLVMVADKQLAKTLEFCTKAAETGTAPAYCTKAS